MATLAITALASSLGASAATAATIGTVAGYASTAMTVLSGISGYQESRGQTDAIKQTSAFNVKVAEQEAQQERASASLEAHEERREAKIMASNILAQAGKGGAIDPTMVNIIGEVAGEGELRARTRMFEGEERARGLETGADLEAWQSRIKAKSVRRKGITTALGKIGTAAFNAPKWPSSTAAASSSTFSSNLGWIDWNK